jgi:hypothetical protein
MGKIKKRREGPKYMQAKEPQRGESHRGKGTTKCRNLHQLHEAYRLKKGGGRPHRAPSLEEPSLAFR